MQPKACSNPRMTSAGMAAPPDTHTRRDEVSACAPAGSCSIAAYIVGTPSKIVTRSRPTISSALAGSNLGSKVRLAPTAMVAFKAQVSPKT